MARKTALPTYAPVWVPTTSELRSLIEEAVASRCSRYESRESDDRPVLDAQGRLHAPHDGWTDDSGRAYAGGEFLAEDGLDGTESVSYGVASEVADTLSRLHPAVSVTLGEDFYGVRTARIYGPAYVVSKLPYVPHRVVVAKEWGLPTGKTWRFSYARWLANEEDAATETLADAQRLQGHEVGYYRPRIVE